MSTKFKQKTLPYDKFKEIVTNYIIEKLGTTSKKIGNHTVSVAINISSRDYLGAYAQGTVNIYLIRDFETITYRRLGRFYRNPREGTVVTPNTNWKKKVDEIIKRFKEEAEYLERLVKRTMEKREGAKKLAEEIAKKYNLNIIRSDEREIYLEGKDIRLTIEYPMESTRRVIAEKVGKIGFPVVTIKHTEISSNLLGALDDIMKAIEIIKAKY